jgi:hypothetical protein
VTDFADVKVVMDTMTTRVARRLKSAGIAAERADIRQELAVAWLKARDGYDPQRGVPFLPYFIRGCWLHVNRWIEEVERQRRVTAVGFDREDATPDPDAVIAEDELIRAERRESAYQALSPLAARVLGLLENPPPQLYAEVEAIRTRAEYGRSQGYNSWSNARLTLGVISDLLGLDRGQRSRVYAELNMLADRFSKL